VRQADGTGTGSWEREAAATGAPLSVSRLEDDFELPGGRGRRRDTRDADRSVARVDRDQTNVGTEGRRRVLRTHHKYTGRSKILFSFRDDLSNRVLVRARPCATRVGDGHFLEPSLFLSH
jgi:ribosomal protein L44E